MNAHRKCTRSLALFAAITAALVISACGSSSNSSTPSSSTPSASTPAATPVSTSLKGAPIVIQDDSDTSGLASISDVIAQFSVGEKAAAAYLNAHGGVGGRPIKLILCDTSYDAGSTTACANQVVSNKAVANIGLSELWGENGLPIIARAWIVSMNAPVNAQDATNPDSFPLGGGSFSEFPAQIKYFAKYKGMKSAVVLEDDDPAGHLAFTQLQTFAKPLGVTLSGVFVTPGQVDVTPFIAKAVIAKPDYIITAASGAAAVSYYQALAQQAWPAAKVINQGAAVDEDSFLSKVPASAISGAYFTYEFDSFDDTANPEVALYRAAMKQYSPVTGQAEFYQWGFANVMTIANIAKKTGAATFDASTLKSFLKTVNGFPVFMGGNLSHTGTPPGSPQIINPNVSIVQFSGGKLNPVSNGFYNPFAS
jgi:branched-chain amino acid transport system substrate-binding protein